MKTLTKSLMFVAVAATALVSCSKEIEAPVENVKKGAHVEFSAKVVDASSTTKATLTTSDDKDFAAAWVNGTDIIGLYATNLVEFDETAPATWNESKETFETDFTTAAPTVAGTWMYEAKYPYDADGDIPFGSSRVQEGNAYNSAYDIMYGSIEYDNALLGKDNDGANFVIPMNRLTGIAYFHITGGPDEDVVSATLEATGIAAENVTIASNGESVAASTGSASLDAITITFAEGTAPKATDLQLWFNVLPGDYTGLKLTVNTTTKKAVLNSNKTMSYTAGKLNKAVLSGLNWTAQPQSYSIDFINKTTKNVSTITNSTAASTVIEPASLSYVTTSPFTTATNAYYGGDETNGLPARIGKSSEAGTLTIKLSETGCVSASAIIVNAKQYSSGKTHSIGVNDSAKQQPGEEYEDLEFAINSDIEEISLQTDGYIYVKYVKVVYTPKKAVTLSFPQASYSITAGDSFTAPTLTTDPAGLTVTYSSSNESVAKVNASSGEVSLEGGIGSTTITATYAGDDEYKSGSAFYTLTVNRALSTSISQIKEDLDGSTTAMSFTASLTNAVVTRKYSDKVAYIQDDTAGILVTDAEYLAEGDSYTGTVSGTIVTANNQPKITSIDVSDAAKTTGATKTPVEVTIATLVGNMSTYDGKLCKIVKVKANSTLVTGNNKSIIISQGENTITLFTRASFDANTIVSGSYYDVVGIPCLYNSTNEIVVVSTDDVSEASITWQLASIAVKTAPTKITYTEGDFFAPAGLVLSTTEEDTTDPNITRTGEDVAYGESTASSFSFNPDLTTALSTTHSSVIITYSGKSTTQAITVTEEGGPVSYTLIFNSTTMQSSVQNYISTWKTICDGFTWSLTNFNNNQKGWNLVKCGNKTTASVGTITTDTAIPEAIETVDVTVDAYTSGKVNSFKLYVASDSDFLTDLQTITLTITTGKNTFTVPNPAANRFYKIEVDCAKGSSNGLVTISKVVYTENNN